MLVTTIIAAVCAFALPDVALATQHLVGAGDDWEQLESRVGPGDEIILMPGTHHFATLRGLRGEAKRPIVIRSLQPEKPSVIEGEGYGIQLLAPHHVVIRDVVIRNARIHAIEVDGTTNDDAPTGHVRIEQVRIEHAVEPGERHAVMLRHIDDVRMSRCTIDGWSGSGIEIVGATDVEIVSSRFRGRESGGELSGVRMRAGSADVRVLSCRFERSGDQAVCIGGASKIEDLRSAPPTDAESGTLYEASRIEVGDCVMVDGRSVVAFISCDQAIVRNCTARRPRRVVLSVRHEQTDPRFGHASRCRFTDNLITWESGDITALGHAGANAAFDGLELGENLWWTPDWAVVSESLGPFPGTLAFPQVTDIDPELDASLRPATQLAASFGPGTA